jgi:hypothetical protein
LSLLPQMLYLAWFEGTLQIALGAVEFIEPLPKQEIPALGSRPLLPRSGKQRFLRGWPRLNVRLPEKANDDELQPGLSLLRIRAEIP